MAIILIRNYCGCSLGEDQFLLTSTFIQFEISRSKPFSADGKITSTLSNPIQTIIVLCFFFSFGAIELICNFPWRSSRVIFQPYCAFPSATTWIHFLHTIIDRCCELPIDFIETCFILFLIENQHSQTNDMDSYNVIARSLCLCVFDVWHIQRYNFAPTTSTTHSWQKLSKVNHRWAWSGSIQFNFCVCYDCVRALCVSAELCEFFFSSSFLLLLSAKDRLDSTALANFGTDTCHRTYIECRQRVFMRLCSILCMCGYGSRILYVMYPVT